MSTSEKDGLVSSTRATDTSPSVQLHPLVLLTISDYITRHTLRRQTEPIVGAILGKQHGRDLTMEAAFECKLIVGDNGEVLIDDDWFKDRLEQFKDVHKTSPLDLVGWFTLGTAAAGPQPHQLPIHERLQAAYNETAVLLLFDPSAVLDGSATGGRLPINIYESFWEPTGAAASEMQIEGATQQGQRQLRFRELAYAVETGEAEMIAVDFVAKGGGNAAAVEGVSVAGAAKGKSKEEGEVRTNGMELDDEAEVLSPEDDELISTLTAKINAIKMLHSRLGLLSAYLSSLPPCYLTAASPADPAALDFSQPLNHPILRSVFSLLSRLPLVVPPASSSPSALPSSSLQPTTTPLPLPLPLTTSLSHQMRSQESDVALIGLLTSMTTSLQDAREAGRKLVVVDHARVQAKRAAAISNGADPDFMTGFGLDVHPGVEVGVTPAPYASPTGAEKGKRGASDS